MRYSGRNLWLLTGLGLAFIVAAHLLPQALRGSGARTLTGLGFGALMAHGCALCGLAYFAMDDIQKQNLKSDWYWGSLAGFGLLCGLVFPYVLFADGLQKLVDITHMHESPRQYFFCGVMITLALFVLGWIAAFLFRRLRWVKE